MKAERVNWMYAKNLLSNPVGKPLHAAVPHT